MAEQQHTAGPWHISRGAVFVRKAYDTTGDGPKDFNICEMDDAAETAQRYADARLISAAPDLLAALKEAFRTTRPDGCSALKPQVYEMCVKAIDKAEGKVPQ